VTRIDPASNTITSVVDAGSAEHPPANEGFGSVWMATRDNKLDRIDPATGNIVASIELEDGFQDIGNGVVVTSDAVWVIQPDKAEMIKVDPHTNSVVSRTPWTTLIDQAKSTTTVPAGRGPDFMWLQVVGDEGGGIGISKGLLRLDPKSGAGLTFLPWSADQNGDGPLTITDDAVWYGAGGHIYRIDIGTNEIDATYTTEPGIVHLAIGFGSVWVANYNRSLVQRLDVAL
jgi:streptogramin lyase